MADLFRRAPWFQPEQPGAGVGATEASGHYVALLARDHLDERQFKPE